MEASKTTELSEFVVLEIPGEKIISSSVLINGFSKILQERDELRK